MSSDNEDQQLILLLSILSNDKELVISLSKYPTRLWCVQLSYHLKPYITGIAEHETVYEAMRLALERLISNREAYLRGDVMFTSMLPGGQSKKKSEKITLADL